jgi:hypothetical protein
LSNGSRERRKKTMRMKGDFERSWWLAAAVA